MINGVLNVYKPQNISSNQVVIKIKKLLNIKKVGHTGTLDPLACGVLPICIGNATKISEYLINKDKVYYVKLKFGILTDTYDCEGKVIQEDKNFKINESKLNNTLISFIGDYDQVPPLYSALKIGGKKAYQLARDGIDFKLKSRTVKINSINNIEFKNDECSFVVKCSKGTYIRSLCKDIGESLGTCATMIFLERIESGIFHQKDSINFESLSHEKILEKVIPIDEVLKFPKIKISNSEFLRLLVNGVCVKNPNYINNIDDGVYFFYDNEENLKGIVERKLNFLKLIKLLN